MNTDTPTTPSSTAKTEGIWALAYFTFYLVYLFWSLENELVHWLSLVLIPLALLYVIQSNATGTRSIGRAFRSVGLDRSNLTNGLLWAFALGLALSVLQLFASRNGQEIMGMFTSGKALYMYPLSLGFMMLMAGTTEEFFFRGFLQTRLQNMFSSKVMAVVVTSLMFGLYHLPYAYLNPHWPSHGNFTEALMAAFGQGVPGGLILGTLYVRSKNNLVACILLHSMINAMPAMLVIKFGGS